MTWSLYISESRFLSTVEDKMPRFEGKLSRAEDKLPRIEGELSKVEGTLSKVRSLLKRGFEKCLWAGNILPSLSTKTYALHFV